MMIHTYRSLLLLPVLFSGEEHPFVLATNRSKKERECIILLASSGLTPESGRFGSFQRPSWRQGNARQISKPALNCALNGPLLVGFAPLTEASRVPAPLASRRQLIAVLQLAAGGGRLIARATWATARVDFATGIDINVVWLHSAIK